MYNSADCRSDPFFLGIAVLPRVEMAASAAVAVLDGYLPGLWHHQGLNFVSDC